MHALATNMSPFLISMRLILFSRLNRSENKFQHYFQDKRLSEFGQEDRSHSLCSENKGFNTELGAYTIMRRTELREWRSKKLLLKVRSLEELIQNISY